MQNSSLLLILLNMNLHKQKCFEVEITTIIKKFLYKFSVKLEFLLS